MKPGGNSGPLTIDNSSPQDEDRKLRGKGPSSRKSLQVFTEKKTRRKRKIDWERI